MNTERPLLTLPFALICVVNFCTFTAFYMLMPVLPLYFTQALGLGAAQAGVLLALYSGSALLARPVAGYLSDTMPLRRMFLLGGVFYILPFAAYLLFTEAATLGAVRVLHGMAFGFFTVTSSTMAVNIIPEKNLGRGVSMFSGMVALGMVLGPALGATLLEHGGYTPVFMVGLGLAAACPLLGLWVRGDTKERRGKAAFNLGHLFLWKGWRLALCMGTTVCLYAMVMNYFAIFAAERGLNVNTGLFFTCLGLGLVTIRTGTGKVLDSGRILAPMLGACALMLLGLATILTQKASLAIYGAALLFGAGHGFIIPAYQYALVRLAPPDRRGSANSTFFISTDIGIGLTLLLGGAVAQQGGYTLMYELGGLVLVMSACLFALWAWPKLKASIVSTL